jgi:pSer/pThr/pTyr-binding forkhead associated (FHA) protein
MDGQHLDQAAHTGAMPIAGTETVPVTVDPPAREGERPEWVDTRRAELTVPGRYLAYEESGNQFVVPVGAEGTRIGRSLSADIRFDDATVSRRHALVVADADGVRVLDDRSLNGVFLNGRRVEFGPLTDGDEIVVGRYRLQFLHMTPEAIADAAAQLAAPERAG